MNIPQNIDLLTVTEFSPAYDLALTPKVPASPELVESTYAQQAIEEGFFELEALYNSYGQAVHDYKAHTAAGLPYSATLDHAMRYAEKRLFYTDREARIDRPGATALLCRVLFHDIIADDIEGMNGVARLCDRAYMTHDQRLTTDDPEDV